MGTLPARRAEWREAIGEMVVFAPVSAIAHAFNTYGSRSPDHPVDSPPGWVLTIVKTRAHGAAHDSARVARWLRECGYTEQEIGVQLAPHRSPRCSRATHPTTSTTARSSRRRARGAGVEAQEVRMKRTPIRPHASTCRGARSPKRCERSSA